VLDKEEGSRPKVSTGVVYVRADLVDEYTEAVCRRPEKPEEDVPADVEMKDAVLADDAMPALEPADLKDVPVIEGVEKE
jgi:ubiquitin carboxyl-terminal hydrolase 25/28